MPDRAEGLAQAAARQRTIAFVGGGHDRQVDVAEEPQVLEAVVEEVDRRAEAALGQRPGPEAVRTDEDAGARHADALIVTGESPAAAAALAARWGVAHAFTAVPRPAVPRAVEPWGGAVRLPRDRPVVAVAGIARPDAFFQDLAGAGWQLADRLAFADHHPFTPADVAAIAGRVRQAGGAAVLTTEKDAVRLLPLRPLPFAAAFVPLTVTIEPEDVFTRWLLDRLDAGH